MKPNNVILLERVISGGQTGIDQLGLEVARSLGIPTGGVAPKDYLTEIGPNTSLRDWYGLTEHESANYPPRTNSNVQEADGTLVLGQLTDGTKLIVDACLKVGKPYLVNPNADEVRSWLNEHQIKILNVAGNRGSTLSAEQLTQYRRLLYDVLMTNQRLAVLFQERPAQWGLRGDPHLWDELEQVSRTLVLPKTGRALRGLILVLISNLIGEELIPGKSVPVARYSFGGMSSGMVHADFWLYKAIPMLQERLLHQTGKADEPVGHNIERMTQIDQVLTAINEQVIGTMDEGDVKHLFRTGKPIWLFEASVTGVDRSERVAEEIQAALKHQWTDKMTISQLLIWIGSGPANPFRLFESVTLSEALVSNTTNQVPSIKMLNYADQELDNQLRVTLLVWPSN